MPDYVDARQALPLTTVGPQSRTGVTTERTTTTTKGISLAPQAASATNLSADDGDNNDLATDESLLNSNPHSQLTTMAAYLTSLQNGSPPVSKTNRESTVSSRRGASDSCFPSRPEATPPAIGLKPHSQHEKQQSRELLFTTARGRENTSQASLAPLRSLSNEIARNAILTSSRRRRVMRKLVCFAAGLLVIYTTYRVYSTSEPGVWPVSWPLVWPVLGETG